MLIKFKNDIPVASLIRPLHLNHIAKLDSGASRHYLKPTHAKYLTNITTSRTNSSIILPNNETVQANIQGNLKIHPKLSAHASRALIVPKLTNESLLSVGQFCDDGCHVHFSKNNVHVLKNKQIVLQGRRNNKDGLWDIPFTNSPIQHTKQNTKINHNINFIITKDKSKTELAQFIHATLFSPAIDTLIKAIRNGHLVTFPGIHTLNFEKLLKTTMATEKGHLDQERKIYVLHNNPQIVTSFQKI